MYIPSSRRVIVLEAIVDCLYPDRTSQAERAARGAMNEVQS